MIFFATADGTIQRVVPSIVNQNSDKANTIYLYIPYPSETTAEVTFTLPNGANTVRYLMTCITNGSPIEYGGVQYNIWSWTVTNIITAQKGDVQVQFYLSTPDGTLTTPATIFTVARGVTDVLPDIDEDQYNEVMQYLSSILLQNEEIYNTVLPQVYDLTVDSNPTGYTVTVTSLIDFLELVAFEQGTYIITWYADQNKWVWADDNTKYLFEWGLTITDENGKGETDTGYIPPADESEVTVTLVGVDSVLTEVLGEISTITQNITGIDNKIKTIFENLISAKLTALSSGTVATITDKARTIQAFEFVTGTYTLTYTEQGWTQDGETFDNLNAWGITATEFSVGSTITVVLALYGNNNLATENYVDGQINTVNTAITGLQGDISDLTVTEESYTIATTDWTALSDSEPFTYSATVTATHTIGTDTEVGIINDQPVLFANYGFIVGAVNGQSVTIYSIEQPSASVTLKIGYKG